jgi:CGNR zinc finger
VHFNHYGGEAAQLAADLVNLGPDATVQHIQRLLERGRFVGPPLDSDGQRNDLIDWAGRLSPCFGAADLAAQCSRVNDLLATATSKPYISLHDGRPHLHYRSMSDVVTARVKATTSAGLAYVICDAGGHRLGRCARSGCGRVYVDTSRNGRRAYCSNRCANTAAVARHRDRGGG